MSVVNRMLQDLDRRRASAAERDSLPQHLQMLPPPRRTLPRRALVLSAAVLASFLALGGGYAWEQSRRGEPSVVAVPIALPTPGEVTTVAAAASSPRSSDDEVMRPRAEPLRPLEPSVVARYPGSSPRDASAPRDAASAANAGQAQPDLLLPETSPEPRRKPVTAKPKAASAPQASMVAMSRPVASTAKAVPVAAKAEDHSAAGTRIEKKLHAPSARERADGEFRRANAALAQGRDAEALPLLQQALREDASHVAARLALARLLAEAGDGREAADVLRAGATDGAGNAEYRGLHAAVLQRLKRDADAVQEYQAALRLMPGNAVWWMGLGLSLEALGNRSDARLAYQQAKSAGTLSGELADFVDQKLRQLP